MAILRSGVSIGYEAPAGLAGLASTQRYPLLIGTALANRKVTDETIRRGLSGETDAAANAIATIVSIGNSRGAVDYVLGQDYQLTGGEIDWSLSGSEPSNALVGTPQADSLNTGSKALTGVTGNTGLQTKIYTLTFTSVTAFNVVDDSDDAQGSGTVGANFTSTDGFITIPTTGWSGIAVSGDKIRIPTSQGQLYYVTYKYARALSDFTKVFTVRDETSAFAIVGDPGSDNLLALGVRLVFRNGSPVCKIVISESNAAAHIDAALVVAESVEDLTDIVILAGPTIEDQRHSKLKAHVDTQSTKDIGKYRMGYVGFAANTAIGENTDLTSVLGKCFVLKDRRVVGVANTWAKENVTLDEATVDGSLIACALVGLKASQTNPSQPLLKKQIIGFSDIEDVSSYVENIVDTGAVAILNRGGVMILDEISTTDTTDANTAEIEAVTVGDYVASYIETRLLPFVGTPIDDPVVFPQLIVGRIRACLETLQTNEIIARVPIQAEHIKAKIDPNEPRKILFAYKFYLRYVLRWLDGLYTFLTTSEVS